MEIFINPLEAVKLIPIFSYLNTLSDFLLIENYLHENDQTKQIPIVNGLYEYLHDNKQNKTNKIKLIRHLLKGSDLYGAKENEHFDVTFVNAMFEHIITSLVFDKYGGLYGFLATIILKVQNLKLDEILNMIIRYLENDTFDNEYGGLSNLSFIAASRIYNDIILPLFPVTEKNFTLLSLDYIYAQAGLMYLQAGRINNVYFTDSKSNDESKMENDLFDQYLVTGQVIELFLTDNRNDQMLKAFALPALTYYLFNLKFLYIYENMGNVISHSTFWQSAYASLFKYTNNTFNDIQLKLQSDITLKMNMAVSSFENCYALADQVLKKYCPELSDVDRSVEHKLYLRHPQSYNCNFGENLPDPKEHYRKQIKNITELFATYYYQLVEKDLSNSLLNRFRTANVVVKILFPNNTKEYEDFSEKEKFDILEFYFPNIHTYDYYLLKQENYSLVLTNEADDPKYSTEDIKLQLENTHRALKSIVLKTAAENITTLMENLTKFKKTRFEAHLAFLDNCAGENKSLRDDWWEEFGLFLIPYSQCSTAVCGANYKKYHLAGEKSEIYKYPKNLSTKIMNSDTNTFLSSLNISVKSVFLRKACNETVYENINVWRNITFQNDLNGPNIFNDIALNFNDPSFKLSFITKDVVDLMKILIHILSQKTGYSFMTIQNCLAKLSVLKSNAYRRIGTIKENKNHLGYVNTLNNESETGYGYKFSFLPSNNSRIAQFRTGFDFKDEKLLELMNPIENVEKVYMSRNNVTLKPEPDHIMYEVNHQLRRRPLKVVFSGIPIEDDDFNVNCYNDEYFKIWKQHNHCRRRQRFIEKTAFEKEGFEYAKSKSNLTDEETGIMLKKYTFPNNRTLILHIDNWVKRNCTNESFWSDQYEIDFADVLNKIRFDLRFESHEISSYEARLRIDSIYSTAEQKRIQENTSIEAILTIYNQQKGMYSLSFHDYYAIRNFATNGYTRITSDTIEAKLMKLALYKLAIRQSEDSIETFNLKLFRVESKPISLIEMSSAKNFTTLQKFTETFVNVNSALRFAAYPEKGFINVIYEMIFNGTYIGAKIEKFYNTKETSVILLPGSEFQIVNKKMVGIGGLGNVMKLKLIFQHSKSDNFDWYKNIMHEISNITL